MPSGNPDRRPPCGSRSPSGPTWDGRWDTWSISAEKLGNVCLQLGQPEKAREQYLHYFEISRRLADADPEGVESQRHLSISNERLGDVSLQLNDPRTAAEHYRDGL